jgi:hypothetical protein
MLNVITFSNRERGEFFFSTDHCQGAKEDTILDNNWVPVTQRLPINIVPRPGFENGVIRTIDGLVAIFFSDMTLIANPDERFRR